MALINKPYTFSAGATIVASEHNSNFDTIYNEFNGSISNANISGTAAITDSKLAQITTAGKVSGASLTSLASIPSGAGTIPVANLPTSVSKHYRSELVVAYASTTTMTVGVGLVDIDGTAVEKTSATTLTISTASDWAGGASLRATSTYGYVGIDSSGNIKMHTTAPSHSDADLSSTVGLKRYVSWASVTYRVIGWFYMNATGSGELSAYEVGNITEHGVTSDLFRNSTVADVVNDNAYGSDLTEVTIRFYATGQNAMNLDFTAGGTMSTGLNVDTIVDLDGSDQSASEMSQGGSGAGTRTPIAMTYSTTPSQGTHTVTIQMKVNTGTYTLINKNLRIRV